MELPEIRIFKLSQKTRKELQYIGLPACLLFSGLGFSLSFSENEIIWVGVILGIFWLLGGIYILWISLYDEILICENYIVGMMFVRRKLRYSDVIGYKIIKTRKMGEKIYLVATNGKIEINPMYSDAIILRDWVFENFPKIEN